VALSEMTLARAREYVWQWLVGSMVLSTVVAVSGATAAYVIARIVRRK
jgi:hypothetical protein